MPSAPDRLPAIAVDQWTAAQKQAAQPIIDGPRGALLPPFIPLLRSPELLEHAQRMGEYLRFRSSIGLRLSELAICITARQWTQQVEWTIHSPIALSQGICARALEDIAQGRRPNSLQPDEWVVYDFCTELHHNRSVSDTTWQHAIALWGEQGVVDLIGIQGYYTFLSMVMNASRTETPETRVSFLQKFPNTL